MHSELEKFFDELSKTDTGEVKGISLNSTGLHYNFENGQVLTLTGDGWYFKYSQ
jgi:hypothetical protein